MNLIRKITFVLLTGFILMYFSEFLFWARPRPNDTLEGYAVTWLFYSAAAYVALAAAAHFRARDFASLFLVGALFGWLVEGVIVQTTYEELPLSISFTGLAWHALISVWFGYCFLPRQLQMNQWRRTVKWAIALGVGYGAWGVWWGFAEPAVIASLPLFAGYAFGWSLLLMAGYGVYGRFSPSQFQPKRWEAILITLLFLFFFAATIAIVPFAPLILLPLLGLTFWGLRRNAQQETRPSILHELDGRIHWRQLALFWLLMAGAGTAVYAPFVLTGWFIPTGYVVYLVTTFLGFYLFGRSLYQIWRPG